MGFPMTSRPCHRFLTAVLVVGAVLAAAVSEAQITLDGSLGPKQQLQGPNYSIGADMGQTRGKNLFHSFGQFNVGTGEKATFTGPSTIANIIGRVTGGQRSVIDGTLSSEIAGANLFLLNPSGVLFKANAKVEVSGSFYVSTAPELRFVDGSKFVVSAPTPVLTFAAPTAFGFVVTAAPLPSISLESSKLAVSPGQVLSLVGGDVNITVPAGQALSLAGGDVKMTGTALTLPGGQVQILAGDATPPPNATLAAPGGRIHVARVGTAAAEIPLTMAPDASASLGRIDLVGATINVTNNVANPSQGTVLIRGGRLIAENSSITANNTSGTATQPQVGIDVQVANDMVLTKGTSLVALTTGAGSGAAIKVTAGELHAQDAAVIQAGNVGVLARGTGGDIDVSVTGALTLTGGARIRTLSQSSLGRGGGGTLTVRATDSADITISGTDSTGTLSSGLVSNTALGGNGGKVVITAPSSSLRLVDGGAIETSSASTSTVRGGDIDIQVNSLRMESGGRMNSRASAGGRGGTISVTAKESALITGGSTTGIFSGGINATSAGDINLTLGSLDLKGGALIQNGTPAVDTQNGNIGITATGTILISDGSRVFTNALRQDVGRVSIDAPTASLIMNNGFIEARTIEAGRAGEITVHVKELVLESGAQIANSNDALGTGRAGQLTVTATDSISISGRSSSGQAGSLFGNDPSSGLFSTAQASGAAGKIVVSAPAVAMADGGKISVSTAGTGAAGDIAVTVGDPSHAGNLSLTDGAQITSSTSSAGQGGLVAVTTTGPMSISGASSGLFSTAASTGNAGQIMVSAPTLTMDKGGDISVATTGVGRAGDVALNAATLSLTGGARIDSSTSGPGQGGTINVATNSLAVSTGAGFSSNAQSSGAGGGVNVQAGQISLTGGAVVSATSTGSGDAGNVKLVSTGPFHVQNSKVTTQATTADGGDITLTAGAGSMLDVVSGQITTSVQSGKGHGGNIVIDPHIVLLDHSAVQADAFGGPGGNINIVAGIFLASESIVSASSVLSTPGTINIQAQVSDLSSSVVPLPAGLLQAATLLRTSCAARVAAGKSSSLVVAGRDGLPPAPGGYLPSLQLPLDWSGDQPSPTGAPPSDGVRLDGLPQPSQVVLDSKCWR